MFVFSLTFLWTPNIITNAQDTVKRLRCPLVSIDKLLYKGIDMMQTKNHRNNQETNIDTFQNNSNNVYHNAKVLLKIYSKTAWEISGKYADILESYEDDYGINDIKGLEIISSLGDSAQSQKISDRLLSVGKNKLIVDVIHSALIKLKDYPNKGELYYQIIYKNYFAKFNYTESEILESLCLSRTTYFRRRKEAVNVFGISLWNLTIPKVLNMIGTNLGLNWNDSGTDMGFR